MNKSHLIQAIAEILSETIRKVDGKWVVYPKHGGSRLGTHTSKEKALAQLRAIEASKHMNEEEQTVDFNLRDINGVKVVLATFGEDKVGALRLKPYKDSYQVDSVIVKPDYRGYGIGKEMYRLAHEKLGPLYSDAHQTPEASSLWNSLIKSGEAKKEGDRFVMTEGPHDAMNPGILSRDSSLKGADGKIKISKVRAKLSSMKDKGSTKAKALRRFINYHD